MYIQYAKAAEQKLAGVQQVIAKMMKGELGMRVLVWKTAMQHQMAAASQRKIAAATPIQTIGRGSINIHTSKPKKRHISKCSTRGTPEEAPMLRPLSSDPSRWSRELPELTATFDISRTAESLGLHDASSIETHECFGLVLDSQAIVMQVNSHSRAANAGVRPGWSVRWIEVRHESCLTFVPVLSRDCVREIFKDCQRRRQLCVNVVFVCTNHEDPTGCPEVGIAYSEGCAGLSADTDYMSDGDSALRANHLVTNIANANQSRSHDAQTASSIVLNMSAIQVHPD